MSIDNYKDPIVSQWNRYSQIIENEPHVVTKGMFALVGLPDIQYRVVIDGYVEIGAKDEIKTEDEFKVDYTNGYVFMHPSKEGETINVTKYASRGANYYPASRVWTKLTDIGEISETLDDNLSKIDYVAGVVDEIDSTLDTVNTVKAGLDNSISEGSAATSQLDDSIGRANLINNTLSNPMTGTIKQATDVNVELSNTVSVAEATNDTLLQTNAQAQTTKSELDSSISTGSTLKVDLDSNISIGTVLDGSLSTTINKGSQLKLDLPPLVDSANTSRTSLETTINNANTKKSELDDGITTANTTRINLDTSVDNANAINDVLSNPTTGTIKQANDINNTLNLTIGTANTSKTNLDTSIDNSITSKIDLDDSISAANTTKIELDDSITEGNILKGDLDTIISGTDYEQLITDVSSLKTDKADKLYVDSELSNKVDNNRVLTDVPVDAKFTDTTYSEITEEEIDIGTSSTLRTITGRRIKYILDKIQGWTSALTKADVGLGNVQDYGVATQLEAETGTSDIKYMTPLKTKQAIDKFKPKDTSELTKSDVYTKTEVDTALAEKVDNSRVLTDVPENAKFTDTTTTINGKTGVIEKEDIVALGIPAQDTTYEVVSHAVDGLFPSDWLAHNNQERIDGSIVYLSEHGTDLENVLNGVTYAKLDKSGDVLENYREKLVTLSGISPAINLNNGNVFTHTLSGNTTYSITNAQSQAHSFTLIITQTGTVRTITFPSSVKWQGGEIPDLSSANKTYVLTFLTINSGSTWLGMFGGEF